MKKNQNGFSIVEALAVILIIGLVSTLGWLVYDRQNSDTPATDNNSVEVSKTYTDTANKFTFEYPSSWSVEYEEEGGRDFSEDAVIPPSSDWTKVSRPVQVKPASGEKDNNVTVRPGCTAESITEAKARKDVFHTQEDLTLNGYTAFYDKLDFKGDAESYLHHTYIILGKSDCVEISYRENHHHDMSNTNFDDKSNVPGFKSIVESLKFLDLQAYL